MNFVERESLVIEVDAKKTKSKLTNTERNSTLNNKKLNKYYISNMFIELLLKNIIFITDILYKILPYYCIDNKLHYCMLYHGQQCTSNNYL